MAVLIHVCWESPLLKNDQSNTTVLSLNQKDYYTCYTNSIYDGSIKCWIVESWTDHV